MRQSDRAYSVLLEEIQSGVLAPGAVLGEVDQSVRLGVSRTPLREALSRLAADGLVTQQSARVTVVTDVDSGDIHSLFQVRRALEETAARTAAARAGGDAGVAQTFAGIADAFTSAGLEGEHDIDAYYALIARFDAHVDAVIANPYLSAALRTVRTHLVRVRRLARHKPERLRESVCEHRLIASAIAAGDADLAAHATHVHLHNALTNILESQPEGQR